MRRIAYNFKYDVKQGEGEKKETIIEGFANRAFKNGAKVIDRGNEHIPTKEWSVAEWMQNPIILFNHDKDLPIGKGLDVKVTEDGLWIKAMISQSGVDAIKKVRDLIEEKILNSFSVGIDVKDEIEVDGSIHLMGVKLIESSVVSLPMNQESQFSISTKMLKEKSLSELKESVTKEKGAILASEIHRRIGQLQEENEGFSREDVLMEVAKQAKISLDELFEFLAGNVPEASMELINVFANRLGLNQQRLIDLNAVDMALNQQDIIRPEEPEEEPEEDEENDEDTEAEGEETDGEEDEEELFEEDAEELPEEEEQEPLVDEDEEPLVEEEDEEEEDKEGHGEDEQPLEEEADDAEPLEEEEELDEDGNPKKRKEDVQTDTFNDCVSKHIREALEAGKEQDQAIAFALSKCRNEKSCTLDPKAWNKIFDDIDAYKKNLMPTVMAQEGYVESSPGDAHLQEARQTNVMLGQLITEIQSLKQIFAGAMMATPQAVAYQGGRLNTEPEKEKDENLDIINDYHRKLEKRLKKLDV